ncbi:unnamed protein product [Cuscuta campestris]|uniref:Uncharacterized protein n=1 Tax=Cuscuta campestris TaxID=132261 RepID=A0A484MKZ7_9ASTE|nr:unnamed protein product [Cuscuta campestris]
MKKVKSICRKNLSTAGIKDQFQLDPRLCETNKSAGSERKDYQIQLSLPFFDVDCTKFYGGIDWLEP